MDTDDLKWLQKVVPSAYNALQTLSRCPAVSTPTSQGSQILSPKIRKRRQTTPSQNRRICVKQENLSRDGDGLFATALYTANNPEDFRQRTNMTRQVFDMLFSLVGEQLNKNSTRQPILPQCRLFVTLVYLSNAERLSDLARVFKMGNSTIRGIVQETCELLWNILAPVFLPPPNAEDWRNIAMGYQRTWQWPHCLGVVDARLLNIDYKDENGIILLASCDAKLNFNCDIATVIDPLHRELNWHHEFAGQLLFDQAPGEDRLPAEPIPELHHNPNADYVYSFIADAKFPMRFVISLRPME